MSAATAKAPDAAPPTLSAVEQFEAERRTTSVFIPALFQRRRLGDFPFGYFF